MWFYYVLIRKLQLWRTPCLSLAPWSTCRPGTQPRWLWSQNTETGRGDAFISVFVCVFVCTWKCSLLKIFLLFSFCVQVAKGGVVPHGSGVWQQWCVELPGREGAVERSCAHQREEGSVHCYTPNVQSTEGADWFSLTDYSHYTGWRTALIPVPLLTNALNPQPLTCKNQPVMTLIPASLRAYLGFIH